MDDKLQPMQFGAGMQLNLPSFKSIPAMSLDLTPVADAEKRLVEAKAVTPSTYADLEHTFGEAYRALKRHVAIVGYQLLKTETELKKAEGAALLERYPAFMADKPKSMDNADTRKSFLSLDSEVSELRDRLDHLKSIEMFVDGRIKVMENVTRYMRKQMDLVIRSGTSTLYYKK
jgi:hypothetical protein